jgi:hypothetical protein
VTRSWLIVCLLGCSSSGGDPVANCPADQPAACPATVPSYAADIAPLIQTYCTTECHRPNGNASDQPLSTYTDLYTRRQDVKDQIYQCRMPMPPAPDPTDDERVTLLTWFVCGAPNN